MTLRSKPTRFRAYQLGSAGSFSYFDGYGLTLIEARITTANTSSIQHEMAMCGVSSISALHITSWDQDHCVSSQLVWIVENLKPNKIEYPGYDPHTDSGRESLRIIERFKEIKTGPTVLKRITPNYIKSLDPAQDYGYRDVIYHPKRLDPDSSNNNSTVKQFRSGSFNVLSLGDVESTHIAAYIRGLRSVQNEVDIMILAHHGAANGFTTSAFVRETRPTIAIASADYANQFMHPKQEIRDILNKNDVRLFTTKTGDIIAFSTGGHTGNYRLVNLKAGSTEISSAYNCRAKKAHFLSQHTDNIRAKINRQNRGPRRRA